MGNANNAIHDKTVASTLSPDIDRITTGRIALQLINSDRETTRVLAINDRLLEIDLIF